MNAPQLGAVADVHRDAAGALRTYEGLIVRDLLIYVAGPLGNEVQWNRNTRRAIDVAASLKGIHPRIHPVIPHLHIYMHRVHPRPYADWLALDFGAVIRCQALYRIEGESDGADREVKVAKQYGRPVFHDLDDVREWAEWHAQAPL